MKIFSPILKGTTTVVQGTTNLSGSFTGSLFGTAATASYADNFTVGGTLTAQTINVQIITSSIEFNTGSTRNGALSTNTHQFTGSVLMSGSVGIGTSSPSGIFAVNTGASNQVAFVNNATTNGTYNIISLNGAYSEGTNMSIQGGGVGDANLYVNSGYTSSTSGDIIFRSGGASIYTERMRILSNGSIGINGTANPDSGDIRLQINGGDYGSLSIKSTVVNGIIRAHNPNGLLYIATISNHGIAFVTNDAERMRITSGGNIIIAKTNDTTPAETIVGLQFNGARILCTVDGTYSAFSRLSSDGDVLTFHRGSTSKIGYISVTTSATAYNTSASDIRLKKNFENWDENILLSFEDLNPQKFNFNSQEDGTDKVKGFIAQEVVDKFPEAYPIDDNGFYSFNPSGMTIYLMKAIQELKSENDTLKEILQRNNIQ
jgi:hypothetical protein